MRFTAANLDWLPLANREAWQSLGNRFSGDHTKFNMGDLWGLLGIVLAGIALVWLLNWIYRRQQARRLSNEPRHLFIDLCRAHRLSRRDRRRLLHLAEEFDISSAVMLFVRPDLFAAENMSTDNEKELAAYQRLADKLFAGLESLTPRKQQPSVATPQAKPSSAPPIVAIAPETVSAPVQPTQ
ncbi:hypothetical protein [Aeoliella sp.]|uniref:hypothetical protein n=1 Tax=Aeoliella sp. TaxID=2795800 RepID=UPI003CCC3E15